MKLLWTPQAAQDRAEIWDYLYALNPQAAVAMDQRFSEAISHLEHNPQLGPEGIVPGTRELIPHQNYRVVYQLNQEAIWILALVHTSRLWPPSDTP